MGTVRQTVAWSLGLWRLARGRIRDDWRFLIGVWLLLACAVTLLASGVLYGDAVAVGGLRAAIRTAPLADQSVLVETNLTAAQAAADDVPVRAALRRGLGPPGGEVALEARSGSLAPIGRTATGDLHTLTFLESATGAAGHASLVAGRWAEAGHQPVEATLPAAAARALGLAVGDRLGLADAATPGADPHRAVATVVVVGTYAPRPDDPFWAGDQLDTQGVQDLDSATFRGPLLVPQADLFAFAGTSSLDIRWRAIPDLERLTADDIEPLRSRFATLSDSVRGVFPVGGSLTVTAGLGRVLETVDRSLQVARGAVLVLTLQFAVVAAYAVLLVAGMLADRRRPEVGLLRSRGASSAHVVALALGEAVLLTVPAALVAPFAASGLVRLIGEFGPLSAAGAVAGAAIGPRTVEAVAITAVLAAIVLTLPTLTQGAELAGIRAVLGRPVARTLGQRLGLDIALVIVAGLAIWQLRSYGAPLTRTVRGTLGIDPLLAAAPAIGLAAGALVATRLVPRLGEIGERILDHGRGLISPLGARQIARRPLRYTRAALLLMLSTALGTFGAAYAASWSASQQGQAAYQAGADVRVTAASSLVLPGTDMGAAYRSLPGVDGAMPVNTADLSVGQVVRSGTLLALDATAAPRIALLPSGPEARGLPAALATLAAARPAPGAAAVPAGTGRLRVTFDADLTEAPLIEDFGDGATTQEVPPDYRGITIGAYVRDADGRIDSIQADQDEPALFVGDGQSIVIALPTPAPAVAGAGPSGPLEVVGLAVSLANAFPYAANPITGHLSVRGLAAAPPSGTTWTSIASPVALAGWTWQAEGDAGLTDLTRGPGVDLLRDSTQTTMVGVDIRLRAPIASATSAAGAPLIPVVASDAFLAAAGSAVGQTITARTAGSDIGLHIVARTAEFPTLDPATPFVIADGPTLAASLFATAGTTTAGSASQWWLATRAGQQASVAAALSAPPYRSQAVVSRDGVLAGLTSDPVGLGTLGALLIGSLAAAAFAIVGFLVGASVSSGERVGEFALLRALGLSGPQLAAWLTGENAFLLCVGLVAGTGIGSVLAVLVLPSTLLGATGLPVVPPPAVVIPWDLLGLVYLGAAVLLAVTVLLVGRPVPGRRIAQVLRAVGE